MRTRGPSKVNLLATRILIVALGCAGIIWGAATFPLFWQRSSIEQVALRIVNSEPYTRQTLASQLTDVSAPKWMRSYCTPAGVRAAAIVRIRMAELAMIDHDRLAIDDALLDAQDAIRRSLACGPADPFLWLGLFWITNARQGFDPRNLEYLRLSYETGPNEGWIAAIRSRIVLAMFAALPGDVKQMAIAEFLAFVKTGQMRIAADLLEGPGWQAHDILLDRTASLDQSSRTAFAKELYSRGYDNLSIPGVKQRSRVPWQQ